MTGTVVSTGDRVVAGVGMSSKATASELAGLVAAGAEAAGIPSAAISLIATRAKFVNDPRLGGLPDIQRVGVSDRDLVALTATLAGTAPESGVAGPQRAGIPARVARTAAVLAAGVDPFTVPIVELKSAHATVALVRFDAVGERNR